MTLSKKARRNLAGWCFITPQIIGYLCFVALPLLFSLYLCFAEWDLMNFPTFVGLKNFKWVLHDRIFWKSIKNTFIYIIITVPLTIVVSLGLAILTNRKLPLMKFFRAALFLPMITSTVAIAMVWYFIYEPTGGVLNTVLMWLGVSNPPQWLQDTFWAKIAIIILSVWLKMGYYYIIFDAAVKNVPKEQYEAADIDGANSWVKIRKILLPEIGPQMFFVSVMLFIDVFNMFSEVYMMTGGGPDYSTYTLSMYIYHYAFEEFNMGVAAVGSWSLFVLVGIITVIQFFFKKRAGVE